MAQTVTSERDRVAALRGALPGLDVSTEGMELYATDIFYESQFLPLAVVAPASASDVLRVVKAAREQGFSLAVRAAGLSYSAGYIPSDDHTLVVDTTRMNRIVEINERDRYVTVEAGVTWAALHDALKDKKLTTPFWGTFSGRHATVGSALSQGAKLYGSGFRGTSAETVIGLKVVTGTGELVTTGSGAGIHRPSPFFRNYGPDLTGLFLGDCGAFGIKVEATLQLIPAAEAIEVASFSFGAAHDLLESMATIGAETLATEIMALDPGSVRSRFSGGGLKKDLQTLKSVATAAASPLPGSEGCRVGWVGGRFARRPDRLSAELRHRRPQRRRSRRPAWSGCVRSRERPRGAQETVRRFRCVMRADPFPEVSGLLTPSGKRLNRLHTVVPNSRGVETSTERGRGGLCGARRTRWHRHGIGQELLPLRQRAERRQHRDADQLAGRAAADPSPLHALMSLCDNSFKTREENLAARGRRRAAQQIVSFWSGARRRASADRQEVSVPSGHASRRHARVDRAPQVAARPRRHHEPRQPCRPRRNRNPCPRNSRSTARSKLGWWGDRYRGQHVHAGDDRAEGRAPTDDNFRDQVRMDSLRRRGLTHEDYIEKMDRAGIERAFLIAVRCGDLRTEHVWLEIPYERVYEADAKVSGSLFRACRDRSNRAALRG